MPSSAQPPKQAQSVFRSRPDISLYQENMPPLPDIYFPTQLTRPALPQSGVKNRHGRIKFGLFNGKRRGNTPDRIWATRLVDVKTKVQTARCHALHKFMRRSPRLAIYYKLDAD